MNEFKKCPFCGGEAILKDYTAGSWFRCKKCRMETRLCCTTEEAIEAWNTRKPVENLITALKNHPNLFTELGWENFYISINDVIETIKERM